MPLPSLPLYLQLLKRIRFLTKLDSVSTCKSIAKIEESPTIYFGSGRGVASLPKLLD